MRISTLAQGAIAALLVLPWLSCTPVSVDRPETNRSILGTWQQVIDRGGYESRVRFIFPDSTHLIIERIDHQAGTGRILDSMGLDFAVRFSRTLPVLTLEAGRIEYQFHFRRRDSSLEMYSITRLPFSPMQRVFVPERRKDALVGVWSAEECDGGGCGVVQYEYSPDDSLFVTSSRMGITAAYRLEKRTEYYRTLRGGGAVDRICYFFLGDQLHLNRLGTACKDLGICDPEQINILVRPTGKETSL